MVSQLSESAVDDVEATADAAAEANEEAKSTKKVERERHTIFIGNIDFGTYLPCVSEATKELLVGLRYMAVLCKLYSMLSDFSCIVSS